MDEQPVAIRPNGGIPVKSVINLLRQRSVDPFIEKLSQLLECGPDDESVRKFAKKAPDRWAQAVAIFAKSSGYGNKKEVTNNHLYIGDMSDMELEKMLLRLRGSVNMGSPAEEMKEIEGGQKEKAEAVQMNEEQMPWEDEIIDV